VNGIILSLLPEKGTMGSNEGVLSRPAPLLSHYWSPYDIQDASRRAAGLPQE
jgi:hypothetical protein